jgi:hypothetical protein
MGRREAAASVGHKERCVRGEWGGERAGCGRRQGLRKRGAQTCLVAKNLVCIPQSLGNPRPGRLLVISAGDQVLATHGTSQDFYFLLAK